MGRLVIAHHKSYHPYRRDNVERVRKDEEEARQKEAKEEGRMMLADSEARMDLLREKSGLSKGKKKADDMALLEMPRENAESSAIVGKHGHINLFEDLEQNAVAASFRATKKSATEETDKGFPLAPSQKDLNPWYSSKGKEKEKPDNDDRMKRDMMRKSAHDPLTSINQQLKSSSSSKARPGEANRAQISSQPRSASAARLSRESSERERALALIRRKKQEALGSATPSTVRGDNESEYGDMYNRSDVQAAHQYKDRGWDNSRRPKDRHW